MVLLFTCIPVQFAMIKTSGAMIYFNTVRFPWATLYDTFIENYIIIDKAKLKIV